MEADLVEADLEDDPAIVGTLAEADPVGADLAEADLEDEPVGSDLGGSDC